MVESQISKLKAGVRFSYPAPIMKISYGHRKELANYALGLAAIAALFVLVSLFVSVNESELKAFMYRHKIGGVMAYIALGVIATVVAPLSSLPFLPLISLLYGWFFAAIFSIIAWSIGSLIAFWIARRYGKTLARKFVSLERLERLEAKIPRERFFWSVVLLRVIAPVDVLSYALGLFSTIKTGGYALATVIGITPFAFVWAYFGGMPTKRIAEVFIIILIVCLIFIKRKRPSNATS